MRVAWLVGGALLAAVSCGDDESAGSDGAARAGTAGTATAGRGGTAGNAGGGAGGEGGDDQGGMGGVPPGDGGFGGAGDGGGGAPCNARRADVELTTQESVESLRGICSVNDLLIGGDVVDLPPLASLVEIRGDLFVGETSRLRNLDGMEGVTSVGGNLVVGWGNCDIELDLCEGNQALENLDGLKNVATIGGYLGVWDECFEEACAINSVLARVGFDHLTRVDSITIRKNPMLTELSFGELESVDGLRIVENDALTSAAGFTSLGSVGEFTIANNLAMTSLGAFPSLASVG